MLSYKYKRKKGGSQPPLVSLGVIVTAIAESAMHFFALLLALILYTTICSVHNLCIVQTCCFLDFVFDQCKCIHDRLLKEWKVNLLSFRWIRFPVPSVVCVLLFETIKSHMFTKKILKNPFLMSFR
jgi:hypothetical protein